MENSTVLITGGAGFIGSNLANHLVETNEVIVVDDEYLGDESNLKEGVDFQQKSVMSPDLPTDVDVVFHLAALSSYEMHEQDPQRGARVNVEGFINTVEQAHESGCKRIVYASTSSLYGNQTTPTSEHTPIRANTAYEASKAARERYAEYFYNHHDIDLIGLRLFSVYQGYSGNEAHKGNYANVIAQFADDIVKGQPPVLYGDGTQTRDFVHVSDVVSAFERSAEQATAGTYNVGTGERRSFRQIVKLINNELGTNIEPEYTENPIPQEVYIHHTCADFSKLAAATGWKPTIEIEEGIERLCSQYLPLTQS